MDLDQRLVFLALLLLQAVLCQTQSKIIVPSQSIVVPIGSDVTLPCEVDPVKNLKDLVVEWARPDLKPRYIHIRRDGLDLLVDQNPQYQGRTQLWERGLQIGDMSLKLSRVRLSDGGTYHCFIPQMDTAGEVTLTVVSVSPVAVSLTKDHSGSPVLRCESRGWYPEPELLWLDSDRTVLTGGRTEVQRGVSDETFSVSSRLSVEQSPGNTFTCRVRQQQSRQSRETQITVTGEFLEACASCSGAWTLFVLAIVAAAAGAFVLWKYKIQKTKNEHREAILRITEEIHFIEESEKLMGSKEVLQKFKETLQSYNRDLKADIEEEQKKEKASTTGPEKKIRDKIHRNESQIKTFRDIIGLAGEEIEKIDQVFHKIAEKKEKLKKEHELMTKHLGNKTRQDRKSEKAAVQPEPGESEVKVEVPEDITKTTDHMEGAQTEKLEEQQTTEKEADVLQPLMDAQRTADSEEQTLRDVGLRRSTQKNQDPEQKNMTSKPTGK